MPRAFEYCQANKGRIRTITASDPLGRKFKLKANQYKPVCFKNNEMYPGETHTKKAEKKK